MKMKTFKKIVLGLLVGLGNGMNTWSMENGHNKNVDQPIANNTASTSTTSSKDPVPEDENPQPSSSSYARIPTQAEAPLEGNQVFPDFLQNGLNTNHESENYATREDNLYSSIIEHKSHEELQEYTFDKLFLEEDLKGKIQANITNINTGNPARPYSLIFDGPPGVGKTYLGRVIARELKYDFLYSCAANFEDKYYGCAQKIIQHIFSKAKKLNNSVVIFIDELEALAGNEKINEQTNVYKNACRSLWTKLDQRDSKILVIFAVNEFNQLPGQLTSRFSDRIIFKNPSQENCKKILKAYYEKFLPGYRPTDSNLNELAPTLVGLGGRDIQAIARKIASERIQKGVLTMGFIHEVIKQKRIEKGIQSDDWLPKSVHDWYKDGGLSRGIHTLASLLNILSIFSGNGSSDPSSNS